MGFGGKKSMADSNNRLQNTEMSGVFTQRAVRRTRFLVCVPLATVITVALSVHAHAQSASFRSVDTIRDGVLSYNELVTQFRRAGADRLLRQLDRNRDNILTMQELRQRNDDEDLSTRGDADRDVRDDDDDRDDDDGGDAGGDD